MGTLDSLKPKQKRAVHQPPLSEPEEKCLATLRQLVKLNPNKIPTADEVAKEMEVSRQRAWELMNRLELRGRFRRCLEFA